MINGRLLLRTIFLSHSETKVVNLLSETLPSLTPIALNPLSLNTLLVPRV